tara:strand:+ start:612 stop:803 length:192 start_codon:yes stop_codon:yes gene_type:complete
MKMKYGVYHNSSTGAAYIYPTEEENKLPKEIDKYNLIKETYILQEAEELKWVKNWWFHLISKN